MSITGVIMSSQLSCTNLCRVCKEMWGLATDGRWHPTDWPVLFLYCLLVISSIENSTYLNSTSDFVKGSFKNTKPFQLHQIPFCRRIHNTLPNASDIQYPPLQMQTGISFSLGSFSHHIFVNNSFFIDCDCSFQKQIYFVAIEHKIADGNEVH